MSRTDVLGVGFDNVTKAEAVERALELIDAREGRYVVTPNPEIVMLAKENPALKEALAGADIVLPDGAGIVKGAAILGRPMKEKVPGIDFACGVMARLAERGGSVYLFGAKPGVAEAAAETLRTKFPGLVISGTSDGYFSDDGPIIEKIKDAAPDFLLVCLGAPKQELWMAQNAERLDVGLMAGLGGSLDVFAGTVMRAPKAWQRMNAEWLYRCIKEPWRFKRIARLPLFIIKAWIKRIRKFFNGKG